jgi:hypothetical protein
VLDRIIGNSRDRETVIGSISELNVRTGLQCVCRLRQRTGLQGNLREQFPASMAARPIESGLLAGIKNDLLAPDVMAEVRRQVQQIVREKARAVPDEGNGKQAAGGRVRGGEPHGRHRLAQRQNLRDYVRRRNQGCLTRSACCLK